MHKLLFAVDQRSRTARVASAVAVVVAAATSAAALVVGLRLATSETPPPMHEGSSAITEGSPGESAAITSVRQALQSGRYDVLQKRWNTAPLSERVEFGQKALGQGGTVAVASPLIRDLWMTPVPDTGPDWRPLALRTLYLAYARMRVDGQLCRDDSGPGRRLQGLALEFEPVIRYGETLPRPIRQALVADALDGEAATAFTRPADPFVCSGGQSSGGRHLTADVVVPAQAKIRAGLSAELGVPPDPAALPADEPRP